MSTASIDAKLLESMPLAVLKTIPAGTPPPGIEANFTNPPTRVPAIVGIGSAFLLLALVCYTLRIYTKLTVTKKWRWDDLTCSLGFLCSIVFYATVVNGCINGAAGRHEWDLHLDTIMSKADLYQSYLTCILVTPALGLIKLSLFTQYYSLFKILRYVRVSVWIGATLSGLFYATVTIAALALTTPRNGETFFEDIVSQHYLTFSKFSVPTGVIGVLVDWTLFILPIPAVMSLSMSTAKRVGVLVIFMTGGVAACASVASLYFRVQLLDELDDPSWKVGYILLFAQMEMFAGVAACSMPSIAQFFSSKNISLTNWGVSLSGLSMFRKRSLAEKPLHDNSSLPSFVNRSPSWQASKAPTLINGGEVDSTKSTN